MSSVMTKLVRVQGVEEVLGRNFENSAYIDGALRLAGCGFGDNKGLAQVGDSVLRLALVSEGFKNGLGRGAINPRLDNILGNQNLARIGFEKGLDKFIYANPSQHGMVSPGPMASTVEALLGAVFFDSNEDLSAVKHVMADLGLSMSAQAN